MALIAALRAAAGVPNVLTERAQTLPFSCGFRYGGGTVAAVVTPTSLVTMWRTLAACIDTNAIVIMQAANTGLTGGSTPDGDNYDRDVVIVNPSAINGIHVIEEGRQVICLAGATLYGLEAALEPLGREPHSVIGSSCIGASVVGGVCNNSGGSLIHRGPAYTELALYAQVTGDRQLRLVNHLGINIIGEPEAILERVERGDFTAAEILTPFAKASDAGYTERVRDIDADTPARFNADPGRLFEASGSAGRIAVFAVRLDTFPAETGTATFYIGTNNPDELTTIRRDILRDFEHLPIAAEYMHRGCFDIAARYGKDSFLAIRWLGSWRMPMLFRAKAKVDRWATQLGLRAGFSDRVLQRLSQLLPSHLPRRLLTYRDRYLHHLILKVPKDAIDRTANYLAAIFPSADGDYFCCTEEEAIKAFLHRFAAAGAAIRYKQIHVDAVEGIMALDIALRRNDRDWFEELPPDVAKPITHALYYGHFFCHVFHQDYIIRKGADLLEVEHKISTLLDKRGAEYPAEHNVGHLYPAKPSLVEFYRDLDPANIFNPGIGRTSKFSNWS